MSDEQRSYLIAYDVKDDRRRSHVAKLLQSYGERMQYSVFLLRIRPAKLIAVQTVLETEIDLVVPEFLRTLVFARPRGDDQFADCTFSPSLDMSR